METNHSRNTHSVPLYLLPTSQPRPGPSLPPPRPPPHLSVSSVVSSSIDDGGGGGGGTPFVLFPAVISPTDNSEPYIDTASHQVLPTGVNSYLPDFWAEDWNDTVSIHNRTLGMNTIAGGGGVGGGGGGGLVDGPYNWAILLLAPLVVFGIAGNTLVILAISLERRLQNVTNYFLLSLAVTDLLVSLIVMPFSIINEFTGRWQFGLILCNLFVTADVLMCTLSILHLCTISLERYIGIRYPLWAKNKSGKRTVLVKITLVWTLAIAITSPITVLGIVGQDNIFQDGQCFLANDHFIIYGSIFAFFIPLTIMVVMYALTVRMLNKQAKLCGAGAGDEAGTRGRGGREGMPMIRRSTSRRHWQRENRHTVLGTSRNSYYHRNHHPSREPLTATNSYPLGAGGARFSQRYQPLSKRNTLPHYHDRESSIPRETLRESAEFEYCNGNGRGNSDEHLDASPTKKSWRRLVQKNAGALQDMHDEEAEEPRRLKELVRKHHVAVKAANILLMRRDLLRKENSSVQTEQKASKVLGVVFMIFVVCWAPFFLVNILQVLCSDCSFSPTLFTVFVWLGYVSSTLNPIIYTVFNKIFKLTFLKLLCCRYGLLNRGKRRSNNSTPLAKAAARHNSSGANSHSALITCNSMCRSSAGSSSNMEESMC
ncbi:D(2) dopamine receptor-like [Littorina saxatilis]|uniref:G-protein coupled receptors family 1 profile domain-containing protein n=1 Tax=Littorina saxatilis TaxID=31220 RepID=A0AAN9APS1_9CAEN